MGRITPEPQKETPTTVTHFSHQHPLIIITTDHHPQNTLNFSSSSCSGCSLGISGTFYSCTTCNFFLHKQCFDMPKKITHPFHKEHALTLLTKPAYDTGIFNCDACFEKGKGFSYSCDTCGVDLHILCAIMPLSVPNSCHPHKLELTFGSPYATKKFGCDVCKKLGGDHWLYRCGSCGFDAHLNCARQQNHASFRPQVQAGTRDRSVDVPQPQPMHQQNFAHLPHQAMYVNPHGIPLGYPVGGSIMAQSEIDRQNQVLFLQAIQQLMQTNNEMRQAMLSGGFGGGDRGVQQLMRMMSGLNNYVGIPGGGGGDILQMLMNGGGGFGGGGGGMDMIQSLLGGNGLDFLGGGGFDFLGALGGFL